jgi:hypothetical protein
MNVKKQIILVFTTMIFLIGITGCSDAEEAGNDDLESSIIMITNINPNSEASPKYLTIFNNKLYFCARDGINGRELWV